MEVVIVGIILMCVASWFASSVLVRLWFTLADKYVYECARQEKGKEV